MMERNDDKDKDTPFSRREQCLHFILLLSLIIIIISSFLYLFIRSVHSVVYKQYLIHEVDDKFAILLLITNYIY